MFCSVALSCQIQHCAEEETFFFTLFKGGGRFENTVDSWCKRWEKSQNAENRCQEKKTHIFQVGEVVFK